jgi:hypothetical protein
MTKRAKVRRALQKGVPIDIIVKRYQCHPSLVYEERKRLRQEAQQEAQITITPPGGIAALPSEPMIITSNGLVTLTNTQVEEKVVAPPGSFVEVEPPLSPWRRFWRWLAGVRS